MAEAAAAAVTTVSVNLKLPQLKRSTQLSPSEKAATARVQAIFNDFAKAQNKPRPFDESGAFGPKTEEHVEDFQEKHNLPDNGIVDAKTWTALLNEWIKLRPLPL
jgi:peptidoglycan hydrolase-like protein with peptidoglycan-binding domain